MKVCTDACIFGAWFSTRVAGHAAILDIGSGTGLLMMMLAQGTQSATGDLQDPLPVIHGIEIGEDCFAQLTANLSHNPWSERMEAFHGDARGYTFPLQYDFIISNPPFYENDLSSDVEGRQLAMHSKELKLDELLQVIVANLSAAETAGILLPFHRAPAFIAIAEKHGLFLVQELRVRQTPRHGYFRSIMTFKFVKEELKISEMTIKAGNVYTDEFRELMNAFY